MEGRIETYKGSLNRGLAMNSRMAGMTGVIIAIFLAGSGTVRAGTTTITFSEKGIVGKSNVIFGTIATNSALLYTLSGVDSTGHPFTGQMVVAAEGNKLLACTFTGPGGVSETGRVLTLIGGASITITPGVGRLYAVATTGSGCSNPSAVSFSETETIEGGSGSYNGATGTGTLQFEGIGNGPTAFIKGTGSATITVP